MNLETIKDLAFRHCEKVVIAAVIIFVGLNVYSRFAGTGDEGWKPPKPPERPPDVPKGIKNYCLEATSPFVQVKTPTKPVHDPFWPPSIRRLKVVELRSGKGGILTARRKAPAKIVGDVRDWPLTEADIEEIDPGRGRAQQGLTEEKRKSPCRVKATIDPKAPDTLVFEAMKDGEGRWIGFEATLANEDQVRVPVIFLEREVTIEKLLRPPVLVAVTEEPERLGVVVLHFLAPEKAEEKAGGRTIYQALDPSYYVVWRKAGHEKDWRPIGRVDPRSVAGKPPPGPRKKALPGLPGVRAPAPARPTRKARPPKGAKGFFYEDLTIESETLYAYRVESVAVGDNEEVLKDKSFSETKEIRTLQQFDIAYIGETRRGRTRFAKIVVFIGPRSDPKAYEIFEVAIGGRIGDVPKAQEAAAPSGENPGAKVENEEVDAPRFVTRFVLVDILPDTFRVVALIRKVPGPPDEEGRPTIVDKTIYRGGRARQVVYRDRKNRLVRCWFEPASVVLPREKGKGKGRQAGGK